MAGQNGGSILQKQKKIKPKIEDVIPEYLDGDMRKAAPNFCSNCFPDRDCARQGGITKTILDKQINGLCGRPHPWFYNPNQVAIKCMKRLPELEQKARAENKN